MSKFKAGDIVVGKKGGMRNCPIVILGDHKFPDGKKAYRFRSCLPQRDLDLETDNEHWDKKDGYYLASYVNKDFKLVWRGK